MADSYVQVPPNSTGLKIETSELTKSDGTLVERQRVTIGDSVNQAFFMSVDSAGRITSIVEQSEVLLQLKRIALLLEILTDTEVTMADVE